MSDYLTHDLVIHIILLQAIILLVILSNARRLHRARNHASPLVYPKVSILIPAPKKLPRRRPSQSRVPDDI
ncbi:MAG TPA: hypothetical protein VF326_15285, partial [Anaerolineaceae bacterium]